MRHWADRVTANDPKSRAIAERALIESGTDSLPLLRRFLHSRDEHLHTETFGIIRRLGPAAMAFLIELLEDERASIRLGAVDILIDFAPDTESVQSDLARAMTDDDARVARDAARALGALGERAAPSVPALIAALAQGDEHLRIYAAEALASIGPAAAPAIQPLAQALRDRSPGVRWAACEALASIGPAAATVVPQLIESLKDDSLYVRICAAGALGSIGAKAAAAVEPLKQAASDPTLHAEAAWALERIAGITLEANTPSPAPNESPTSPRLQTPTANHPPGNPPIDWDEDSKRNITWSMPLGDDTFGRPVFADGVIYIGTDNQKPMNPAFRDECGVLMAFRAADGQFLWQDLAPRVSRGQREFLLPSTTSAAHVEGDRLYYVTADCQLRCLDTRGFRDGENNGPFQDEPFKDEKSADIIWELDLCAKLGVFVHEAASSEVLPLGDLLIVCTSNGRNEGHTRVPSPRAPGLIAVDKRTGDVVWRAIGAGADVLHGQWCSPVAANVNGRTQVLHGGGDGWLRAYDAPTGREIWRFDGNPKDARWLPRPGVLSRSGIIASPVFDGTRVIIAMGEDPSHGDGPSLVHAISPGGHGDVTASRLLWTSRDVGRVVGTPILHEGLLYIADLGGYVHCLDAATGKRLWMHDTHAAIWGCLFFAGDRIYAGTVDGFMTVLRAGHRREVLKEIEMGASLYARPTVVGDAMFLATSSRLFRIEAKR